MKITVNIDDSLLKEAMTACDARTRTEALEEGLREIIALRKRRELAALFGREQNIIMPHRRRSH